MKFQLLLIGALVSLGEPHPFIGALLSHGVPLISHFHQIFQVSSVQPSRAELKAAAYLGNLNDKLNLLNNENVLASWAYASNITDANEKISSKSSAKLAEFMKGVALDCNKYDWQSFKDTDLKRKFKILTKLGHAALPDKDYEEYLSVVSEMQSNLAKTRICNYKDQTKCDMQLDPEIQEILTKSRDPEEMKYYWTMWHAKAGTAVKDNYLRYLELNLKSAKLNNFTSQAEAWLSEYEDDTIEQQLQTIYADIRPLYEQIHGYVRWRLRQVYGDKVVSEKGPIPMHLLGDMYANNWAVIGNILTPYPEKASIDVTEEMVRQGYTPKKMFELGDDFFQSLSLKKVPRSFWEKSIIEKPKDGRDLICQATAWDFYLDDDVRIKQCTRVTQDQLFIVHHELGHVQYFLQYAHQPNVYRTGANPGFHEAVGDVLSLAVSTPRHLEKIGLLKNYKMDEEARINKLFLTALTKIAFLPFAFTLDKYRWSLFRGEVKPENMNCAFWKLRDEYSGIEPPVVRSEKDFDPPAKYHISADVDYLRYLVSFIIQFQFYKTACIKAGQYDPKNPELPLDNCDFYGSAKVGKAFKAMLSMGASKPWPEAMKAFTGERVMSGKPIAEYFEPLRVWLEAENLKNNVPIGWTRSDKCVA